MRTVLQSLINKQWVQQGNIRPIIQSEPPRTSGFSVVDEKLHGGWPAKGMVDIQMAEYGIGELQLLLPSLAAQDHHSLLVWIDPPAQLCASALEQSGLSLDNCIVIESKKTNDGLWAAEQCLRSGCCHSVILWQQHLNSASARRLQLAAKQGNTLLVVLRLMPEQAARQETESLPVALRLTLTAKQGACEHAANAGLEITINKQQGHWPSPPFILSYTQLYGVNKHIITASVDSSLTQSTYATKYTHR